MDTDDYLTHHILSLLEPSKLETSPQMAVQLAACSEAFDDFADVSSLLGGIFGQEHGAHILSLLVSSCDSETITEWLWEHFPTDYYQELTYSVPYQALTMLSTTLISLINICTEIAPEVMQNHYLIAVAPQILAEVLSFNPMVITCGYAEDLAPIEEEEEQVDGIRVKRKGQSKGKRQRQRSASTLLSPLLLRQLSDLGLPIPIYHSDRESIGQTIMERLQRALMLVIYELKQDTTALAVQDLFFERSSRPAAPSTLQPSILQVNNEQASVPTRVPVIKASLYFDSVEGFGQWRVQIAGRAEKHMRELRRAKPSQFKAVVKKIKELSRGHFSDENQVLLNKTHTQAVPIFEARVDDTGVVYQIDCSRDYDSQVDTQVLKIFDVCAHSRLQLDEQFWDSVALQLGSNGREYRRRCEFRSSNKAKDRAFMPATFPPIEEDLPVPEALPEIPKKNLEEIHSLLVLEKFVTFSQALLNSILANIEVSLPFDMTPQEKEIVQHAGSSFVIGRSGTGKTTSMLFKMLGIERAYATQLNKLGADRPRQIFVTQSRVLATKVHEYFKKLLHSLAVASQSGEELKEMMQLNRQTSQLQSEDMVDQDEEYERSSDLPKQFSSLLSEHFPLFVSFDQLCKLIEADVHSQSNTRARALVTYDVFNNIYWPHFPQYLTKGLDPASVYSEFIGVIKGSEDTLTTPEGFLDADTYGSLSYRTQPAFAHYRSAVHELFMVYMKQRAARGEYDPADRTHRILGALKKSGIQALGDRVDFLYVDESQDNLLIDALLLRLICKNPNGLFFAGDTAQTISAGCSFRFDDLKALIYRAEESHGDNHGVALPNSSPQTFHLSVNYRSHGGIVDAARSVIELIMRFFPYSIDALAQECGVVAGAKPVFFQGFAEFSGTEFEEFFFGDKTTRTDIEFGAAQCILVRDEAAQTRLRQKVGNIGQIMTLYDCKGLEFNDVLLFNFFEESPVDLALWRVLLNALPSELAEPAPAFSEFRHASISSELKKLYVAMTRARKNLWIVDRSEKSEPMRRLWASREQIFCCTPADGIPRLAVSSTKEEWAQQGLKLFQHKRYYQARDCFKRASLPKEAAVCQAYYLRDEAQKIITNTSDRKGMTEKNEAFVTAAKAFYLSAQQHAEKGKTKRTYFRISAECYEAAQELELAADTYALAWEFNAAAKLYRHLEMFGPAVDIIQAHREDMDEELVNGIMNVARLYYFTREDLSKASALFTSHDEAITFLQDRDLDVAEATLLESLGKNVEAARIHLNEGRVHEAIELCLKDPTNEQAARLGVNAVLPSLWKSVTFGVGWKKDDTSGGELLERFDVVDPSLLENKSKDELTMFRTIARRPSTDPEFKRLGRAFAEASNWTAALFCFDSLFIDPPRVRDVSGPEAVEIIQDFLSYARILREAALHPTPQNEAEFQKLFGFVLHSPARFLVLQGTVLHTLVQHSKSATSLERVDGGVVVPEDVLCSTLKDFLRRRLINRIKLEHQACRYAQSLDPCFFFTLQGQCERPDLTECKRQHVEATATAELVATYRARVRLHMQQFLILQIWHLEDTQKYQVARYLDEWVGHLYKAMFPLHPLLGVLSDLDIRSIPEFNATINLLRTISRNITYNEVPTEFSHIQPRLITRFMQIAFYGFTYDAVEASAYVKRAACWNASKPPSFIRSGNRFIMNDVFSSHMPMNDSGALANGLSLIVHVIKTNLSIDAGVLCDFIDHQVALFCATQKLGGSNRSTPLHGLTLPRSWMLHLLQSNTRKSLSGIKRDTHVELKTLVDWLSRLTNDIYDRTLGKFSPWSDTPPLIVHQSTFSMVRTISRDKVSFSLYFSFYALGFNSYLVDTPTQQAIIKLFQKFQKNFQPDSPFPLIRFLSSYASVRNWSGVLRLIQESPFEADITIRLHHSSHKSIQYSGIRTVVFTTFDDALLQVSQPPSSFKKPTPDSGLSKKQHIPREEDLQPGTDGIEANQGNHGTEEVEAEQGNPGPDVEGKDTLKTAPPTQEEISAALKIQGAYRKWLLVKSQFSTWPSYHPYFLECLKAAQEIKWSHSFYYRCLFFAGLPYILDSLDKLTNHVLSLKKETKRQLNAEDTSHFEMVNDKLTVLVNMLKGIKSLKLALQPKSDIHRRKDLEALRKNVQMVWDLFYRSGEDWDDTLNDEYLKAGYTIIMDEKELPENGPKLEHGGP